MTIPSFTPYGNLLYFVLLFVALLPIVLGLLFKGTRLPVYQTVVTLLFLFLSFGGKNWQQGLALIGYVLWQTVLVKVYFNYRQRWNRTDVFYSVILLSILPLALVKITPFAVGYSSFLGFLGISYLTFKSVQLLMEIRDGQIKDYFVWRYIQFLLFFPTISAGPIDRYRRFEKDWLNPPNPEHYLQLLAKGVHFYFVGFLYKFILGYWFGSVALPFAEAMTKGSSNLLLGLLLYTYSYSMYLFFDFAGYSLFAVGTSYLLGYETPMNFNKPFLSANIKEFWNRWHMSLSFWFRDYVYMRLMFTLMKKKVFKSRIVASNVGYVVLFLLMGIWHGLTWYYLVYGLYHAALICFTDAWLRFKKKHKGKIPSNRWTKMTAIFLTFHAVCLSFLIFSGFLDTLFFK